MSDQSSPAVSAEAAAIHSAIRSFIDATNRGDAAGILYAFKNDAVVNDQLIEYSGTAAITRWIQGELIALNVRIIPENAQPRDTGMIVTARVKGDFDGFGLPEPLILSFYFSTSGEKIDQLIILRKDL